jgi:hypothetical protein
VAGPPTTVVNQTMNTVDDGCLALRDRCPIDLSILSRWFLEHDVEDVADAPVDTALSQEVAV